MPPKPIPSNQLPPPPVFGVKMSQSGQSAGPTILEDIFDDFEFDKDNNDSKSEDGSDDDGGDKKRKRSRTSQRNMTEEQKIERRERNREHAKRSRVRKKFLLESLQQSVQALQDENEKLKSAIRSNLPGEADKLLDDCLCGGSNSVLSSSITEATKQLDDPDYSLVKALQTAQQNFVISDPSLPDNPIVYASQGFLALTGYTLEQVLGRNCRFLQGPDTDPSVVLRIRKGIEKGDDTTVVLLNYRADGSTFWNQFFIAPLRDADGNVVNFLGVQCQVSEDYAKTYLKNESINNNNNNNNSNNTNNSNSNNNDIVVKNETKGK